MFQKSAVFHPRHVVFLAAWQAIDNVAQTGAVRRQNLSKTLLPGTIFCDTPFWREIHPVNMKESECADKAVAKS